MERVTEYRTDPELTGILVTRSRDHAAGCASKGVRFAPI